MWSFKKLCWQYIWIKFEFFMLTKGWTWLDSSNAKIYFSPSMGFFTMMDWTLDLQVSCFGVTAQINHCHAIALAAALLMLIFGVPNVLIIDSHGKMKMTWLLAMGQKKRLDRLGHKQVLVIWKLHGLPFATVGKFLVAATQTIYYFGK